MHISKNKILIILIALLTIVGGVVWYFALFSIKEDAPVVVTNSPQAADTKQPKQQTIKDDNKYALLKGEAFDEAYVADMLALHEGAVSMSEKAQSVTNHEEILQLAGEITYNQSMEMIKMVDWQKEWGYKPTMGGGHMSHGGKGMAMGGDMVEMLNKLKDLKGDKYDKEFLKQMIIHHKQAVEMSRYAEENAKHQEIKDFADGVMTDQAKEIKQMKQWQKDWGY